MFGQRDLNLRQIRWLELLKDHDISALYHLDKANIVVDALSLMFMGSMNHVKDKKRIYFAMCIGRPI